MEKYLQKWGKSDKMWDEEDGDEIEVSSNFANYSSVKGYIPSNMNETAFQIETRKQN